MEEQPSHWGRVLRGVTVVAECAFVVTECVIALTHLGR